MSQQPYVPYPGAQGGWQGAPPPPAPPPPPPSRSKTGWIVGLAVALAIAVVALVVVLVSGGNGNGKGDDSASPGATGGTGGAGGGARAARPTAVPNQQPVRPKSAYEQVAFDYVSAVQNNDLGSAQRLTCASFRGQVKLAPLGLRSPSGVTVNKVDTFDLGGSSAVGGSGSDPLEKATVGIRVQDGENWVQWVFAIKPVAGEPRICGQSVIDKLDLVPDPT